MIQFIPPSFVCPKEGARKRHPDCPGPAGSLVLLAVDGTLETRLRLKQVQRPIPSTPAMLSRTVWGYKKQQALG